VLAKASQGEPAVFEPVKVEHELKAMGTRVTFITHTTKKLDEAKLRAAFAAGAKEIERLEALMSSWRAQSDVSRLNRAQGQYVEVSPETFEVLEKSLWAGEVSKGSFDVTFQALLQIECTTSSCSRRRRRQRKSLLLPR
jgi:thiamine biosynthesis lipoprotein